jgi:hypothetical protein
MHKHKSPPIKHNYARQAFGVFILNYVIFMTLRNTHILNSNNVTLFPGQVVVVRLELRVPFAPLWK